MKRGQIWVETVIYTLIALVMIGLVLTFVKPKIEEIQDKSLIEQSIVIMENIDTAIKSVEEGGQGNKRLLELGIKKGFFRIDGINDTLSFEIEGRHAYSEPGKEIYYGDLKITTETIGKINTVKLERDYSTTYNLSYNNVDSSKKLLKAAVPYDVFITNKGGNPIVINFDIG